MMGVFGSEPNRILATRCELLALELRTRRLLWRRQLPFRGLVNAIEAPWL